MKSLTEILLEKLQVTKSSDNVDDPINEEYNNFIEKEWIDMQNRDSLIYFKEVEIPNNLN